MNSSIMYTAIAALAAFIIIGKLKGEKKMSSSLVSDKIKGGARIVDVRTPDEFTDGAYPKAKNIPLAVLPVRLNELEPKDKPIVLYCASGARSAQAARILKQAGFTDVNNAGGIGDMPR
jgi:phage shock protein E